MAKELTIPMAIHLATALPALAIGGWQLFAPKGGPVHRWTGWAWVVLMLTASVSSFWILEIRRGAGFSPIHLLSAWVPVSMGLAIWFIRRGNVRAHKRFMVGTCIGLAAAGAGALLPSRFLGQLLF